MFTTNFWDTEVKTLGAKARQVSKSPDGDFLGIRYLNTKWDPDDEDNWSITSSEYRYVDPDAFVRPGNVLSQDSEEFKRITTGPEPKSPSASSKPKFVMGEIIQALTDEDKKAIKYFDDNGIQINQSDDLSAEYAEWYRSRTDDVNSVAKPPVYFKKLEPGKGFEINPLKTTLLKLDPVLYL
jgi:hypothetical protein